MAAAQRFRSKQGDTLDQLLWREAGLGPGELTRVLDANPGLADSGKVLPLGIVVLIPATATTSTSANRVLPLIQLWS